MPVHSFQEDCTRLLRMIVGIIKSAKEIELIEEGKLPQFSELLNLSNWQHHTQNILKEGRLTHFKPEELPENVEEEQYLKEKERKDPFEARLKPISMDIIPETGEKGWQQANSWRR